jgi:hypothetical protein
MSNRPLYGRGLGVVGQQESSESRAGRARGCSGNHDRRRARGRRPRTGGPTLYARRLVDRTGVCRGWQGRRRRHDAPHRGVLAVAATPHACAASRPNRDVTAATQADPLPEGSGSFLTRSREPRSGSATRTRSSIRSRRYVRWVNPRATVAAARSENRVADEAARPLGHSSAEGELESFRPVPPRFQARRMK